MSYLKTAACCLDCSWHGLVGDLIGVDTLHCPSCQSANWHPAERETVVLKEYHGEKPERLN